MKLLLSALSRFSLKIPHTWFFPGISNYNGEKTNNDKSYKHIILMLL